MAEGSTALASARTSTCATPARFSTRAGLDRGAGRDDIVDHDDALAANPLTPGTRRRHSFAVAPRSARPGRLTRASRKQSTGTLVKLDTSCARMPDWLKRRDQIRDR